MNSRSLEMKDLPPRHRRGFALVVTLFLMVLLTVIAVGLLSMSASSTRASNSEQTQAAARANAKIGLMLALSELQKAAGPDQRITSQADIFDKPPAVPPDPTTPPPPSEGRSRWVGVWTTNDTTYNATYPPTTPPTTKTLYNPAAPDTKKFVRWLVSSDETATTATTLTTASTAAANTDVEIFKGVDADGKAVPANSVKVPKVQISTGTSTDSKSKNYYAYWVEDEGVKADLGWKESDASISSNTAERQQAARLSAAPGVDYGVFGGPFTSQVKYPITKNPSTTNPWLANIDKALSPADMPLLMSSGSHESNWLKSVRHDVTLGSRGVMADVKKGGLRRDLSLAFEMDGAAESPNTTNFNTQTTEFVGGNDPLDTLSAPRTLTNNSKPPRPKGLPVNERFLYRDMQSFNKPFSSDIIQAIKDGGQGTDNAVMRGPNWWALRDYANLYKRLTGSSGNYTLQARAYFPNRDSENIPYSDLFDFQAGWGDQCIAEERSQAGRLVYIYRPARPSYAPVNLGVSVLISAKKHNGKLAVVLDPIVYLWNPYNRKLKFDSLRVILDKSFPGRYKITRYIGGSSTNNTTHDDGFYATIPQNFGSNPLGLNFTIQNTDGGSITMNPGEVMAATPVSQSVPSIPDFKGEPGYFTGGMNSSGIVMTRFRNAANNQYEEITINAGDTFSFEYKDFNFNTNDRFNIETGLPNPSNATQWLQTQFCNVQLSFGGRGWDEYAYAKPGGSPFQSLTTSKQFFGLFMQLMKPALFGKLDQNPTPVEVFSRFNPAPMLIKKDIQRYAILNQTYRGICDTDNNLLNNYGFGFSGSERNTFWGASYESATGSTTVPATNIPTSPLMSLVEFSHANLSLLASDPFHAVGNSWSSPLFLPSSVYGKLITKGNAARGRQNFTAADHSWLMNDALFDRYTLSGMAPAFTIGSGGYTASGTINATLTKFFSSDYKTAQANPVLRPYLPPGGNSTTASTALAANDGYKKMGAYSLIDGAFNVNSTSVSAWTALLRANRELAVTYAQGGTDSVAGSPFPRSSSPTAPGNGAQPYWSGFSRLTDSQIDSLATEIVKQVKLRGPFMSLSDFINHKLGPIDAARSYTGALQAAIDATSINEAVRRDAGGTDPEMSGGAISYMPGMPPADGRKTTTGIPGDITQADVLLPLAPRLAARSDTFRIRSYGEVRSSDGKTILSQATCETIVQRVPEYADPATDAANNEPWDEAAATGTTLNATNLTYGRRFRVVQTRWLTPNEL
jgi:type II secretory pathway pseudopilin PulG